VCGDSCVHSAEDDKLDLYVTCTWILMFTTNRARGPLDIKTTHIRTRLHTSASMYTYTRMCLMRASAPTHMHIFVYLCLLKQLFACASTPLFPLRDLSPQLGDMIEILVALSGVIGSGHRRLSQAADAVLDETEEVKGKPGTEKSSGPNPVDCGYVCCFVFLFVFVAWFAARGCGLSFWNCVSAVEREEDRHFIGRCVANKKM
jgi:hypothetical protein